MFQPWKGLGMVVVSRGRGRRPVTNSRVAQATGYWTTWENLAPSSVARYLSGLRFLAGSSHKDFMEGGERLTTDDVVKVVISNPQLAPSSRSTLVKSAKAWERAGGFLGWFTPNGILDMHYPVPPSQPGPALKPSEVSGLVAACTTSRHFRLVYLGLYAGTRVSEATKMDADCWEADRLTFVSDKTKREVEVPLHPELVRLKDVILADSELPPQSLKATARQLRERTGVSFTSNSLRRTFIQRLLDLDVPVWVVDDLVGHAPKSVTFSNYARIPWHHKTEAIGVLNYT